MVDARWLRDAVRARVGVNILLAAVAAIAVACAVFGPLLIRSVEQFAVRQAVTQAGADGTAITARLDFDGDDLTPSTAAMTNVLAAASTGSGAGLWGAPQVWNESDNNIGWVRSDAAKQPGQTSRVRLSGGSCAGLLVSSGRCPAAAGEVAVSAAGADLAGVGVGDSVALSPLSSSTGPTVAPVDGRIVGIYDDQRSPSPMTRPDSTGGTVGASGTSGTSTVSAAPVVMTSRTAAELQVPIVVLGRVDLTRPVDAQTETAARDAVAGVRAALLTERFSIDVTTGLTGVLDQVDAQVRSAGVLVLVSAVQALALSVLAIFVVLQRVAFARTAEWGIGRLRGISRPRWFASIYAEPGASLGVGAVLGLLAGLLAARWSVTASLGAETAVEPWRWPVWAAAAGVVLVLAATLVLVSQPSLRTPLVELLQQQSETRRMSTVAVIVQSSIVLLALATLYQLRFGQVLDSSGSQLGLLAPALLAAALAILAVRVTIVVVRRITRKPPKTVTALVVGRHAARVPSSLYSALVVSVGTALCVFTAQMWVVSQRNQDLRAAVGVGAPTVLTVGVPTGKSLTALVDQADPSGRQAMAAQQRTLPGENEVARVLAVDTRRLPAVSDWPTTWSDPATVAALRPDLPEPSALRGSRVTVTVSGVSVRAGVVSDPGLQAADPHLRMTVLSGQQWRTADLGSIRAGSRLSAALPCGSGCELVHLGLVSAAGAAYEAELTVTSLSTDQQPASEFQALLRAAGWSARIGDLLSAEPRFEAVPQPGTAGLRLTVQDQDGGNAPVALPPSAVNQLPALVGPETEAAPFPGVQGAVVGRGLDGEDQILQVAGTPRTLPRLVGDGVLYDLTVADRLADPSKGARTDQVWLAAGAPASVEAALVDQGVTVLDRQQTAERAAQLDQESTTRATAAAGFLGLAALLLTLVALVAARVVGRAGRRTDWRSLADGGLPGPTLRRLSFVENALPAVLAALLGTASGIAGFAVAAERLPLVDLAQSGPPLDLAVPWIVVAALGAAVVLVAVLIAAVGAWVDTRSLLEEDA